MKKYVVKLGLVVMTGIIVSSCNNSYSSENVPLLSFDTGKVTKVDKVNDLIYLNTNSRRGADKFLDGALGKDSTLKSLKRGDKIVYGYDSLKRVDTIEFIGR